MAGMTPLEDCVLSFSQCAGAEKDSLTFLANRLGARYVPAVLVYFLFVLTYRRAFKLGFHWVSL